MTPREELIEAGADALGQHAPAEWDLYGQVGCPKCGTFDGGDYEDHLVAAVLDSVLARKDLLLAALGGIRYKDGWWGFPIDLSEGEN